MVQEGNGEEDAKKDACRERRNISIGWFEIGSVRVARGFLDGLQLIKICLGMIGGHDRW